MPQQTNAQQTRIEARDMGHKPNSGRSVVHRIGAASFTATVYTSRAAFEAAAPVLQEEGFAGPALSR